MRRMGYSCASPLPQNGELDRLERIHPALSIVRDLLTRRGAGVTFRIGGPCGAHLSIRTIEECRVDFNPFSR
jgi:hypothetical protein